MLPRSTERAQPGGLQGGPLRDEKRVTPPPAGPPRVWSALSLRAHACASLGRSLETTGGGRGPPEGGKGLSLTCMGVSGLVSGVPDVCVSVYKHKLGKVKKHLDSGVKRGADRTEVEPLCLWEAT